MTLQLKNAPTVPLLPLHPRLPSLHQPRQLLHPLQPPRLLPLRHRLPRLRLRLPQLPQTDSRSRRRCREPFST